MVNSSNPYMDDMADDDILHPRSNEGLHTFDGTECNRCNRIHDVVFPKDTPHAILARVSELLDNLPDGMSETHINISASTPVKTKIVAGFAEFVSEVGQVNRNGPLLRAVSEVLDEQTGGEVSRRLKLYNAERPLLVAHTVSKTLEQMMTAFRQMDSEANRPKGETDTLIGLFDSFAERAKKHVEEKAEAYRVIANELGVPIDEQLIATGEYSIVLSEVAVHATKELFDVGIKELTDDNTGD